MTQFISFQYRDPEDTELVNRHLEGIVDPGVKQGFEVTLGSGNTISIRPGVLFTQDCCRIEETEQLVDACDIPANESAHPRCDLVVCEHRYLRSVDPPAALYRIVQGEPGETPVLPDVPIDCIALAFCYIPAGATQYTEIVNFITHLKQNCWWDDDDDCWRIRFGNKMALLVSICPNGSTAMSIEQGLRVYMHPGGIDDNDPIAWTRVMELTPTSFTELEQLKQEIMAARGSMPSLDARLDVSLNEDGTYKRVGILDQVLDEVEAARGSMESLDQRLDASLDEDGSYKRVGLLENVLDEVEQARGSEESLDSRLDASLNEDGTIKISALPLHQEYCFSRLGVVRLAVIVETANAGQPVVKVKQTKGAIFSEGDLVWVRGITSAEFNRVLSVNPGSGLNPDEITLEQDLQWAKGYDPGGGNYSIIAAVDRLEIPLDGRDRLVGCRGVIRPQEKNATLADAQARLPGGAYDSEMWGYLEPAGPGALSQWARSIREVQAHRYGGQGVDPQGAAAQSSLDDWVRLEDHQWVAAFDPQYNPRARVFVAQSDVTINGSVRISAGELLLCGIGCDNENPNEYRGLMPYILMITLSPDLGGY